MIDGANLNKLKELNQLPLNQEAKRWLKVAGWSHDPMTLYVYQLIVWGIEEANLRFENSEHQEVFEGLVQQLQNRHSPEDALLYLQGEDSGEPILNERDLQAQRTPQDAAWQLIDHLNTRIMSDADMYGIYPPQHQNIDDVHRDVQN